MPFIATGERIDVLGVSVSQPGLVAGATFLVKATLGVMASLSLAATTDPVDLLRGLRRLHMPEQLVSIMGFMIRSEEHTSELQSLMRISYAVFCLKQKTYTTLKKK